MSEWSDMSTHGLLFQRVSAIQNSTKRVGLVQNVYHQCNHYHYHPIEM
jgi:hypothetical protein